MDGYAKLAIAAGAVIALAFVGLDLLPSSGGPPVGGPAVSPSPSPSAPQPASLSPELRRWPFGDLEVQRYHVTVGGLPLSFAFPSARWRTVAVGELIAGTGSPNGVREDDYAWILTGLFQGEASRVAKDPCRG